MENTKAYKGSCRGRLCVYKTSANLFALCHFSHSNASNFWALVCKMGLPWRPKRKLIEQGFTLHPKILKLSSFQNFKKPVCVDVYQLVPVHNSSSESTVLSWVIFYLKLFVSLGQKMCICFISIWPCPEDFDFQLWAKNKTIKMMNTVPPHG